MYGEEQEREIWEEGQWDRRPGSPRSVVARGGLGFHLALVFDDCFVSAALFFAAFTNVSFKKPLRCRSSCLARTSASAASRSWRR